MAGHLVEDYTKHSVSFVSTGSLFASLFYPGYQRLLMRGSWLQSSVSGDPYSDCGLAARHNFGVGIRPTPKHPITCEKRHLSFRARLYLSLFLGRDLNFAARPT